MPSIVNQSALIALFCSCHLSIAYAEDFNISINGKDFDLVERGAVLKSSIWQFPADAEKKKIFVCWESSASNNVENRNRVQSIISNTWQKFSKLEFVGWGSCTPMSTGIRIMVEDSGPHTKGLGRYLDGMPNGMVLNFEYNNWKPACQKGSKTTWIEQIAVHEFGHAIGFSHEQNRTDTPSACKSSPQGTNPDTYLTPWDPKSVMNYCYCDTEARLSDLDKEAVKKLY